VFFKLLMKQQRSGFFFQISRAFLKHFFLIYQQK
jgi:hypothetical protein